jgi:hypothetical protein
MKKRKNKPPQQYCKCGCGAATTYRKGKYSTWSVGHHNRKKRELVFCACGCGLKRISIPTNARPSRYINGHANRGRHYKMSKETKAKISAANMGRAGLPRAGKLNAMYGKKHSTQTKLKISTALKHIWKQRKKLLSLT